MDADKVHTLTELYERYSGPVFGYLLRLCGDRPLADELTGETFYRAVLALDGFRGEASVKTWLLRIARNLYLRRAQREQCTTSLEGMQGQRAVFAAPGANPEAAVLREERSQAIQRALLCQRVTVLSCCSSPRRECHAKRSRRRWAYPSLRSRRAFAALVVASRLPWTIKEHNRAQGV